MRLKTPCKSISFQTQEIYGQTISLKDFQGRRVMLSFFRDAACPFCNFRIYELANNYKEWQNAGLEVIVVFSSTAEEVRQHVARHPRPFHMIADPELALYNQYGVEHSSKALFKALLTNMPEIIRGIKTGGRPRKNPHVKIIPADFLLESDGRVVELWYGRDTADHIPLERIQRFVNEFSNLLHLRERRALQRLRIENKKLKQKIQQLMAANS